MSLTIGGITVPLHAVLDLSQRYQVIGGWSDLRLADGSGLRQTTWTRLRTVIDAGGWMPSGLAALDYSEPLVIECLAPRSIATAALTATLPVARRADSEHAPRGYAWNGFMWVATGLALVGDAATLAAVPGALGYRIDYWPRLVCLADPPQESGDLGSADYRWTLTAEEV